MLHDSEVIAFVAPAEEARARAFYADTLRDPDCNLLSLTREAG